MIMDVSVEVAACYECRAEWPRHLPEVPAYHKDWCSYFTPTTAFDGVIAW